MMIEELRRAAESARAESEVIEQKQRDLLRQAQDANTKQQEMRIARDTFLVDKRGVPYAWMSKDRHTHAQALHDAWMKARVEECSSHEALEAADGELLRAMQAEAAAWRKWADAGDTKGEDNG